MFEYKVNVLAGEYPGERIWFSDRGIENHIKNTIDPYGKERIHLTYEDGKFYRGNNLVAEVIYKRTDFPKWYVVELDGLPSGFSPVLWTGPMPEYGVDAHDAACKLMHERLQMERAPHDKPITVAVRRDYGGKTFQHYVHTLNPGLDK